MICSYYEFASESWNEKHSAYPKNSRKGNPQKNVTLSEIDTLLSLKIFGNTNYLTGN